MMCVYRSPRHMLAFFELCLAPADYRLFRGRESIMGVDQLLGLDDHQAFCTQSLNKITLLKPEIVMWPEYQMKVNCQAQRGRLLGNIQT